MKASDFSSKWIAARILRKNQALECGCEELLVVDAVSINDLGFRQAALVEPLGMSALVEAWVPRSLGAPPLPG